MLVEVSVTDMSQLLNILEKMELGQTPHIPVILHLLQSGFLDSLVTTETKFVKAGNGGQIEVHLTPTPLLKFLAS